MPDPPAFMRRPRHRRSDDAPRVEISDWVRIMARRCEASLQNDCSFGFVSWNYFFRSAVNLSRTTYAYERNTGQHTDVVLTAAQLEGSSTDCECVVGGLTKLRPAIKR